MFSRAIYMLCVAVMCYASFYFYPRCKQYGTESTISWDVSGYYLYLPSLFIYKDLKHQAFKQDIARKYHPSGDTYECGFKVENGNFVLKYSSGMAIMYSPFFAVANILARPLGYPADGYSAPYQLAIQIGGLLVAQEIVKCNVLKVPRLLEDTKAKDIYLDVKAPDSYVDSLKVCFAGCHSDNTLQIDNLKIWSFDE